MPAAKTSKAFTVPAGAGTYATERLTIGVPESSMAEQEFNELLANVHTGAPANCVVEVWLPKFAATGIDADYTYSGWSITGPGALFKLLAAYPGFQIRVKSGGTSGTATVYLTAR